MRKVPRLSVTPTFGRFVVGNQSKIGGTVLLLFLIALFAPSCDSGPPPAFTTAQRELMDTIYLQKVSILRPQLDSSCEANFSINVQKAVDSLIKVRKEEEARLRARTIEQQGI